MIMTELQHDEYHEITFKIELRTSKWPPRQAKCKQFLLWSSTTETSASCLINSLMAAKFPFSVANISGVWYLLSAALISAPYKIKDIKEGANA